MAPFPESFSSSDWRNGSEIRTPSVAGNVVVPNPVLSLVVRSGSRDRLLTYSDQHEATESHDRFSRCPNRCVVRLTKIKRTITDTDKFLLDGQLKSLSMELLELIPMEGIERSHLDSEQIIEVVL